MASPVITPRNVNIGRGEVYFGVTNPATGSPLSLNANGYPATGTHAGAMLGATVITYKPKAVPLMAEQFSAPIDFGLDTEEVDIEITMGEATINNFKNLLMQSTPTPTVTPAFITFGGKPTFTPQSILVVQPKRDTANTYLYAMLYKAYLPDGFAVDASRAKFGEYKLKFRGMSDTTRPYGDQILHMHPEVTGV